MIVLLLRYFYNLKYKQKSEDRFIRSLQKIRKGNIALDKYKESSYNRSKLGNQFLKQQFCCEFPK